MNKVNFIPKKKPPKITKSGDLFLSNTGGVYMLIYSDGGWASTNIEDGDLWTDVHDSKEEAVRGLTPLGDCEITIKQI